MHRPLLLASLFMAAWAQAQECRRTLTVRFAPVAGAQTAVWLEDPRGEVTATLMVTRATGVLGIANRPGHPRFKGGYRFPYGARDMVLPVWAHARNRRYPRVIMGGATGPDDNETIAYHAATSSAEPYFCSPQGGASHRVDGVDVVSCASFFTGSKGLYGDGTSLYPPRADLTAPAPQDSADAARFTADNDLVAVSAATPRGGGLLSPPLVWPVPAGLAHGRHRLRVEVHLEGDFNHAYRPCSEGEPGCTRGTFPDRHANLRRYGEHILGQPAMVWSVPLLLDDQARRASTDELEGYADWDGATGTVHPPDSSITRGLPGSGAERLAAIDQSGAKVVVDTSGCAPGSCRPPAPPTAVTVEGGESTLRLSFRAPEGERPLRYDLRYRVGGGLDGESFALGTPAAAPVPGPSGESQTVVLDGLPADAQVTVGIRSVAPCGATSASLVATAGTGSRRYRTLEGCFVATAAFGSPLAGRVEALRGFRDRTLLPTPLGRLSIAAYYALSPAVARAIAGDERLRGAARRLLAPLAGALTAAGR